MGAPTDRERDNFVDREGAMAKVHGGYENGLCLANYRGLPGGLPVERIVYARGSNEPSLSGYMAKTALELNPEEWKQFSLPDRPVTPAVKARWEKARNRCVNKKYIRLSERILDELDKIDTCLLRAFRGWHDFKNSNNELFLDSVALSFQGIYNGLEIIFQLIVREVDEERPNGENWHQLLLIQMSSENEGK
jgi:hypothetical protein